MCIFISEERVKGVGTWKKVQLGSLRTNILRAAITKNTINWKASTTEVCFLVVLEARSPWSSCRQGWILQRAFSFTCMRPLSSSRFFFPMCTNPWRLFLFTDEHQSYWIRAPPNGLILPELPLNRPYLQI